jgi:hypothetical protein
MNSVFFCHCLGNGFAAGVYFAPDCNQAIFPLMLLIAGRYCERVIFFGAERLPTGRGEDASKRL